MNAMTMAMKSSVNSAAGTPARYYAGLIEWLGSTGFNTDVLLRESQIDPAVFRSGDSLLSRQQVDALVHHAPRMTGRPDLGMDMGQHIKLSTHEILGYGILSSPTLDYALRLVSRFFRLVLPNFRVTYRRGAEVAEYEFIPTLAMSTDSLRFHLDAIAVATHEHISGLAGKNMCEYTAYLSMVEPSYVRRYHRYSQVIWKFGMLDIPGLRMVFPCALVDVPLAMADRHALKMAEERCEALLQRVEKVTGLSSWLEMMLREARDGMPSLDDLARILNLTPRTLERRLKAEGCQFHSLAKRIRHEKACELLRSGSMSITQVALELGYTDLANFTRAFKRESGMTPRDFTGR